MVSYMPLERLQQMPTDVSQYLICYMDKYVLSRRQRLPT